MGYPSFPVKLRFTVIIVLIAAYWGLGLYFRGVLDRSVIYSHFAYVPIVISGIWWGKRSIITALVLGLVTFSFNTGTIDSQIIMDDAVRVLFFIVIGLCVGLLSEHIAAKQKELFESEQEKQKIEEIAQKQEEQLVHSTRLAELGEMAASVAHELNQPLTGIRNFARNTFYMIEQSAGSSEEITDNLRLISDQVDRASRIINQMRELTRKSEHSIGEIHINDTIRDCLDFLESQFKLSGIKVSAEFGKGIPPVPGDKIRLEQVFLNLLTNARQAMEESAEKILRIATAYVPEDTHPVSVVIADTGKGFDQTQSEKLFIPFFSTKEVGSGTGLGLSISLSIIKDHNGIIEAKGRPRKGAVFTVKLPELERHGERKE